LAGEGSFFKRGTDDGPIYWRKEGAGIHRKSKTRRGKKVHFSLLVRKDCTTFFPTWKGGGAGTCPTEGGTGGRGSAISAAAVGEGKRKINPVSTASPGGEKGVEPISLFNL